MLKTFTLACIASVGLTTKVKIADMLTSLDGPLGRVLESNTKFAQVSIEEEEPEFVPTREEEEFLELI